MRVLSTMAATALAVAITVFGVESNHPASAGPRVSAKDCRALSDAQAHGQRVDKKHADAMRALLRECSRLLRPEAQARYERRKQTQHLLEGAMDAMSGGHSKKGRSVSVWSKKHNKKH
jgi:hypothetical protein